MDRPNIVYVVLDSCRFDSFHLAQTPHFDRVGQVEPRMALGTWTAPAMFQVLMGRLPHHYGGGAILPLPQFGGADGSTLKGLLGDGKPGCSGSTLTLRLKELGYNTEYHGQFPPMNYCLPLRMGFDVFGLERWFEDQVEAAVLESPYFAVFHIVETHSPFASKQREDMESGRDGLIGRAYDHALTLPDRKMMRRSHRTQVQQVSYVDTVFGEQLVPKLGAGTWLRIFADHGEAFGEGGLVTHAVDVDAVRIVPYIEGIAS